MCHNHLVGPIFSSKNMVQHIIAIQAFKVNLNEWLLEVVSLLAWERTKPPKPTHQPTWKPPRRWRWICHGRGSREALGVVLQSCCLRGQRIIGWWFQRFLFSPLCGEDSHFDWYVSKGLKAPTTCRKITSGSWISFFRQLTFAITLFFCELKQW